MLSFLLLYLVCPFSPRFFNLEVVSATFQNPICQLENQAGFVYHLSVHIRNEKPKVNKVVALGCRTTTCTNDASPNEPRQSNRLHGWCAVKPYRRTSMLHILKLRTQTSFALTVLPSTNNPAFEEPTPNTGCTKIHCKTTMRQRIVVVLSAFSSQLDAM